MQGCSEEREALREHDIGRAEARLQAAVTGETPGSSYHPSFPLRTFPSGPKIQIPL